MEQKMIKPSPSFLLACSAFLLFSFLVVPAQKAAKPGGGACPTPKPPPSETSCYATAAGCLDNLFGTFGLVTTTLNSEQGNHIKTLVQQPDGKIVGIGTISNSGIGTSADILVARYNEDGSLDRAFGRPDPANPGSMLGYTWAVFSVDQDNGVAGALQADGKILAAGNFGSGDGWAVARFNQDGSPDTSFSGDGMLTISSPGAGAGTVKILSDGKILVGGDPGFTVIKLNDDGSFDTSFGNGGSVTYRLGAYYSAGQSMAIQRVPAVTGEEMIVGAGSYKSSRNGQTSFAVTRLRSSGSVDTSFGSGGTALTGFNANNDQARSVAIDSQNRVVAFGVTISSCTNGDFAVARYSENGMLDRSFSGDGKAILDVYGENNSTGGIIAQSDGKTVLGGNARYINNSGASTYYFTLIRLNEDGSPDAGFGPGGSGPGVVTTRFPDAVLSSYVYGMTQQSDGKIVAGGVSSSRLALARYWQ